MNIDEWKAKNTGYKRYAHFDKRVSLNDAWSYIINPENIKKHSFYPFIHFQKNFQKYNRTSGIKQKERELCYAAHIDRCIFQYYSFMLNQLYNIRTEEDGINDCAIAYRDNLKKNNIHFAKDAFDFIKSLEKCFIIVGDFTHFFDSLEHNYLKERICDLLKCKQLPDDYYAIFKNLTKYSFWELTDLLDINKLDKNHKGIKELNNKSQVLSISDFKKYKKLFIVPHKENYGIPQGSPISAVLSNVYMLNFDCIISDYVKSYQGFYMRYSDDFIIVLPERDVEMFSKQFSIIRSNISKIPNLKLQDEKTQIFHFKNQQIINCNQLFIPEANKGKDLLNYLGFTYDGNLIAIIDKTISKYHYRMYGKIKSIVAQKGYTKQGKRISNKQLYLRYSYKGANKGRGNFLKYIERAEKVFGKNEAINRSTKNHMQKIKKRLSVTNT